MNILEILKLKHHIHLFSLLLPFSFITFQSLSVITLAEIKLPIPQKDTPMAILKNKLSNIKMHIIIMPREVMMLPI
ncbi:hypothetical protein V4331_06740 [Lactococcus formosensis subsp. formosensis]|uniref:hypothetical protein n=1 Tax=Lactococcus formosensis TaxID=1281486 RepID=UPI0027DD8FAF|nr:hypothetical protein [uncultured Lactococcus sp.]